MCCQGDQELLLSLFLFPARDRKTSRCRRSHTGECINIKKKKQTDRGERERQGRILRTAEIKSIFFRGEYTHTYKSISVLPYFFFLTVHTVILSFLCLWSADFLILIHFFLSLFFLDDVIRSRKRRKNGRVYWFRMVDAAIVVRHHFIRSAFISPLSYKLHYTQQKEKLFPFCFFLIFLTYNRKFSSFLISHFSSDISVDSSRSFSLQPIYGWCR